MIVQYVNHLPANEFQSAIVCTICGQEKPAAAYYSKGTRKDGACKECRKRQRRSRYRSAGINEKRLPHVTRAKVEPLCEEQVTLSAIAELFLILEAWQAEGKAQREISNQEKCEINSSKVV